MSKRGYTTRTPPARLRDADVFGVIALCCWLAAFLLWVSC